MASNDQPIDDNVRPIAGARSAGLAVAPTVLDRSTGEVVDLAATGTDTLAAFLTNTRELEAELRQAKALVAREVHRRMDAEAKWTARVGGYELRGESPDRTDYDTEGLDKALRRLVRRELITREAAKSALERVVTLKPRKQGIKALAKLGGEVEAAVVECERPVDRERRVSVSRLREAA